jgi:hypothetical protein
MIAIDFPVLSNREHGSTTLREELNEFLNKTHTELDSIRALIPTTEVSASDQQNEDSTIEQVNRVVDSQLPPEHPNERPLIVQEAINTPTDRLQAIRLQIQQQLEVD